MSTTSAAGYEQLLLGNQLCFPLYAAARLTNQLYHEHLGPLGITYPQYLVLLVLWEQDAQPVTDIGKRLLLDTNTLSPLLKKLQQKGLVQKQRSSTDERQVVVRLTEAGWQMRNQAAEIPRSIAAKLSLPEIETAEASKFAAQLRQLVGWIQQQA